MANGVSLVAGPAIGRPTPSVLHMISTSTRHRVPLTVARAVQGRARHCGEWRWCECGRDV